MSWLKKLFGKKEEEAPAEAPAMPEEAAPAEEAPAEEAPAEETPEGTPPMA